MTKCNIIKVGDLGIARVLENQNDMASTLIGTPYYMSPELFSNKPYNHKVTESVLVLLICLQGGSNKYFISFSSLMFGLWVAAYMKCQH